MRWRFRGDEHVARRNNNDDVASDSIACTCDSNARANACCNADADGDAGAPATGAPATGAHGDAGAAASRTHRDPMCDPAGRRRRW